MFPRQGGPDPPDTVLKDITDKTDFSTLSQDKKSKIFRAAVTKLASSQGSVGKELKHVISNLLTAYNELNKNNNDLKSKNNSLIQQINDLKKPAIPPAGPSDRSWSNVVSGQPKKPDEFVVIISHKSTEPDLNLRKLVDNLLYPVKKQIAIVRDRTRNGKYIIVLKNEIQQSIVFNKLKSDPILECSIPSKKIPTLIIREVPKELSEAEIKSELCENEDLKENEVTIKKVIANKNFKTNRVKVNFSKEATIKIIRNQEVKIRSHCKPIAIDWGLIFCNNCGKPGHFHKDLNGTVTCKSSHKHCSHCDGDHYMNECQHKNDRSKAKCTLCKGNHRAYHPTCPERLKLINKIRDRFIDF